MAFTPQKHLQADQIRLELSKLEQSKQELTNIKIELETNKTHNLRLVYSYDDLAKQINLSDNSVASASLIDNIIVDIDAEISSLEREYNNICK